MSSRRRSKAVASIDSDGVETKKKDNKRIRLYTHASTVLEWWEFHYNFTTRWISCACLCASPYVIYIIIILLLDSLSPRKDSRRVKRTRFTVTSEFIHAPILISRNLYYAHIISRAPRMRFSGRFSVFFWKPARF